MFESIIKFFKKFSKEEKTKNHSKDAAKERLHLVLMQDRANVSADFLDLMKQEIIEVIKKYIDVDENEIDVRLANKTNEDGTTGAPALYANIPIISIKEEAKKDVKKESKTGDVEENIARPKEENKERFSTDNSEDENKEAKKKEEKEDDVGAISNRPETKSEEGKEESDTDNNDDENKENKDGVGASIARPEKEKQDDNKESVSASTAGPEKDKQDNKKEAKK